MKSKLILPLLTLGCSIFLVSGVLVEETNAVLAANNVPQFENDKITLDIYAEYDFNLLNYDENANYEWSSSNTSLATIKDGHLSCLGQVGEVTITVKLGRYSDTCLVSIKNQMINPSISTSDCLGFVNVEVFPTVQVRYDGNYYPLTNYTLTSKNTDIAKISNNQGIIGQNIGVATIEVNATWKGKTLKAKSFKIDIGPENSIVLEQDVYDIYSVDESSVVKKNYIDVTGDIYFRGEKASDNLIVELGTNSYLSASNNRISVTNHYDGSEVLEYNAFVYCETKPDVKEDFKVRLHSNYVSKTAKEEVQETFKADIELGYESFKGHPNAYKYHITDSEINKNLTNPTWAHWECRIEFFETTTKNGEASYNYMMESGYTLLSFDLYYTGIKGILMGAYGALAKQYFYNEVRVNRDDMLLVDENGIATNTLTNDRWYTVYIKISEVVLKSMTTGQDAASLYVAPCYIGDTVYFDNIRYHYDFSALEDITIGFDNEQRHLLLDSENENKASSNNEMVVYSPSYVDYQLDTTSNLYKYNSSNASNTDREARSKIQAYHLIDGKAVNKGYQYLAFDYIYGSGAPILYYFNNYTNSLKNIVLNIEGAKTNSFVSFYKDGKPINQLVANTLINIVVRIDTRIADSMYITSNSNTIFEIGNFNYYKDNSYMLDYSYESPFIIVTDNIDIAFVNDVVELYDYVSVLYLGEVIKNFALTGFRFSSYKGEYLGEGKALLKEKGELVIDFIIRVGNKEARSSIKINIKDDSYLTLPVSSISLYAGEKDYFEKTYLITPLAVYNKSVCSPSALNYELVNDNGVIKLENNKITALKEGHEQIKVSLPDNSSYQTFEVDVFNKYRKGSFSLVLKDATYAASYYQSNETVYDVNNPYKYYSSTASWNNKLEITETSHTNVTVSKNNIINTHIDFITYKILLTPNTSLRIACVNSQGGHTNVTFGVGSTINFANNDNINVTDLDGQQVTGVVSSNTWYLVTIDYSNFKNEYKSGYTCNELVYLKGTCYLSDIRYYHDSIS